MIPRIDYSRSRGLAKSAEVHMFNAFLGSENESIIK